ncbi:MAG: hypothetical protein A3G81_27755 [Betaproteobacteria bacterium RIFCSPLOWO2_12_FULL_65_14]|nr:MAG: hypothetical protein A3G81_27755 [Betaproteobacteria bacterium RIFCSPLOWO2_12_FULL_65_14]
MKFVEVRLSDGAWNSQYSTLDSMGNETTTLVSPAVASIVEGALADLPWLLQPANSEMAVIAAINTRSLVMSIRLFIIDVH